MITFLALGDSYTIGELVEENNNFPNIVHKLLQAKNIAITKPVIIAKTGWTTDELFSAISEHNLQETYSLVTLLIGVNNQYRGRSVENYAFEFDNLLQVAISFAAESPKNVIVLSIPDWGVTPFANDRDTKKISDEIDLYNKVNEMITKKHQCNYISITESTRENGKKPEFLASDGLHPSEEEYAIWAKKVFELVTLNLKNFHSITV